MTAKKTWMTIVLAVSMITGLAACSTSTTSKPETDRSAEGNKQATKLTVALDWYPNAVHSFLYAAQEQGYFEEENLDVHLQMPSDSNDPLKMVAAGKVDLAISYQTQLVAARAQGVPVLSVAALVRHPLNAIMTRKDSGLDSPEKLAGKAIGYPSIPFNESIVRTAVQHAGGDDSGLSFVDIGFDIVPALTGKKVDAVVGGYINHEQLILEKNGIELSVFSPTSFGVPDYYELVLATSDDQYEQKKAVFDAFLRAAAKGQQFVKDNPKAALDLLLAKQAQAFPLEKDIETKSLEILLPLMDAGDKPFGHQTEESWQTLINWMKEKGLITGEVKADQVMRNVTNQN